MKRNINSLIAKYGEPATLNGAGVIAFVDEERKSRFKKLFSEATGLKTALVLVREGVDVDDVFVINGTRYLVYNSTEIRKNGVRVYSDVELYEDDFNRVVKIYNQRMKLSGVNLPSIDMMPYIEQKARIKTVKPSDYIEYSFHNGTAPTHKITVKYSDLIKVDDLVEYDGRRFDVVKTTNIDELDVLLVMDCVEVINE